MKKRQSRQKKLKNKVRRKSPKFKMGKTDQQLTSQSGLIPVVKFLEKIGFEQMIERILSHEREGGNAVYSMTDIIFLCVIGIVGGGRSLTGILAIWADGVLAKLSGWLRIPDDTTLGRVLKTAKERHIAEMESGVVKMSQNPFH